MSSVEKSKYHFEFKEESAQEEEQILSDGISNEAFLKKNVAPIQPFGFFIKDDQGTVLGGTTCYICFGSLHIDMLWLKKEIRHQGFGKKLMMEAEKIGRERRCTFVTVDTMDFLETLPFYQKLGYQIEFVRKGYSNESTMYMLKKELSREG